MSLKFTVVARKNLSKGAPEDSKLFYAQARQMGTVGIDELCDEIAETCTLTSANLLFYPGKRLRSARKEARFEKFVAKKEEQKAGGGGNESPGA